MRYILPILFFLSSCLVLSAQDSRLASQYFNMGEYEKAAEVYLKLSEKTNYNDYYFDRYLSSLLALQDYDTAENVISKRLKHTPQNVQLYVFLANVYERQTRIDEAEKQYDKAIDNLPADPNVVFSLANAYQRLSKYEYAVKTYKKGEKLLNNENQFAYQLGNAYLKLGETELMIDSYLKSIGTNESRKKNVQNVFNRNLDKAQRQILKEYLFEYIQDDPDNLLYAELLEWVYIQNKEYEQAMRQAIALDLRLEENGNRVHSMAQIASNDKDFDTAIKGYSYLADNKGRNSSYYYESRQELISNKKKKILYSGTATDADLASLEQEYKTYLSDLGRNKNTAYIMGELAELYATLLDNIDGSITLLEEVIQLPGVNKYTQANAKIRLGDFYIIKDEMWEATLLYSQVDKAMKEEFLGEKARYKNALLSYYNGNFEWSQKQFDVLKASTSKLISNDAIDKSVFILDNLALDTTDTALRLFSKAELLGQQNKYDEAFLVFEEIETSFKDHSLVDDIYYEKANIYTDQRNYDKAVENYKLVIEKYPDDIRADNSIFELAKLYETKLNQPEEAMKLYEKLFIDYSNSTLAIEARKQFRILRGDDIQ